MRQAVNTNRLRQLDTLVDAADRDVQLLSALSDPDLLVRRRAIVLSARFVEPSVLVSVLRDGSNAGRRGAALSALRRQIPYCFEALRRACHDQDPDVAISAMEVLSCGRDHEARVLLESLADHGDENVAVAAVEALGRLGDPRALAVLLRALERGEWQRMAAIVALGELRDGCATPLLIAALEDPEVRDIAISALGRLGDRTAIVPLARLGEKTTRSGTLHKIVLALGALVPAREALDPVARRALHHLCATARVAELQQLVKAGELELAQVVTRLILAAGAGDIIVEPLVARAARELEDWGDVLALYRETVERALPDLLGHPDPELRIKALQVADDAHGVLDMVLRCAEHDDPRIRAAACALLGRAGHRGAADILVTRLCRGAEMEREAARGALAALGSASLPALSGALAVERDAEVRVRLLSALAGTASQDVGPLASFVFKWVRTGPVGQRRAALSVCATLSHPDAHAALVHALDDADATVSGEAARHLARSGDAAPILARLEQSHPARFRWIAALGLAGNEQAAEPLIALYDAAQPHERITIAGALARVGGEASVRFLTSRVGDDEVTIRRVAAEVVSGASSEPAFEVLEGLARDTDWVVRKWAVRGLSRLATPHARTLLVELARDIDDMVSEAARIALGHAVEPCS